jgi:hypothetical protein
MALPERVLTAVDGPEGVPKVVGRDLRPRMTPATPEKW